MVVESGYNMEVKCNTEQELYQVVFNSVVGEEKDMVISRINQIKMVRLICGCGLKKAKDMVMGRVW